MRRSAVFRMIFFGFLTVALIGILISGIAWKQFPLPRIAGQESADVLETGHGCPAKDVDRLKIDWVAGKIVIVATDRDDISATEELLGSDKSMVLKKGGSTLYVEACEDNASFRFGSGSSLKKNLYICVPQDWDCKELEIDAASATVVVERLTIDEVESSTASGAHTFTNCQVEKMEMETVSGNLDFSGSLNKLEFSGVSAQADLVLSNHPISIQIESVSGDLNLTLPEDCGFTLDKDSLGGRISSELETTEKNGKLVHGDGSCEIEMEGVSSSVHIRKGK